MYKIKILQKSDKRDMGYVSRLFYHCSENRKLHTFHSDDNNVDVLEFDYYLQAFMYVLKLRYNKIYSRHDRLYRIVW